MDDVRSLRVPWAKAGLSLQHLRTIDHFDLPDPGAAWGAIPLLGGLGGIAATA
jgi:hypothetical protein